MPKPEALTKPSLQALDLMKPRCPSRTRPNSIPEACPGKIYLIGLVDVHYFGGGGVLYFTGASQSAAKNTHVASKSLELAMI